MTSAERQFLLSLCGCVHQLLWFISWAKCKLTGWKWLQTKARAQAAPSVFWIVGTWLKHALHPHVTCEHGQLWTGLQFMKHCTQLQYLFLLHSREKPVPYYWMHTMRLCLNTEVREKQTVRASHMCSAAPFSSTLSCLYFLCWLRCSQGSTVCFLKRNYFLTKKWHSLFFFICFVQRGESWQKFKLSDI